MGRKMFILSVVNPCPAWMPVASTSEICPGICLTVRCVVKFADDTKFGEQFICSSVGLPCEGARQLEEYANRYTKINN